MTERARDGGERGAARGTPSGHEDPARTIARTVLYEGYLLWPYRRDATKNRRRWTFGGLFPRGWSRRHGDDRFRMRGECLVRSHGRGPGTGPGSVRVVLRFLQVVERRVARVSERGGLEFTDEVEVEGERRLAWDEARERELPLEPLHLRPDAEVTARLEIRAGAEREWLKDSGGRRAGAVVREWRSLAGEVRARCEELRTGVFRLRVEVQNDTPWTGAEREDAVRSSFVSTHLALEALDARAEFLSLQDPPPELARTAERCENDGWWPVLVGRRGGHGHLLFSPIILTDHPAIAPESPGDLFDGGEIDELLSLHVLALPEAEREEMRATDPRAREILDRTSSLGRDDFMKLHGALRDPATGAPREKKRAEPRNLAEGAPDAFWEEMGRAPEPEILLDGVRIGRGSRVRLRPAPGGDVMDLALAGKVGIVEGIDRDQEGEAHLAVVVEGDPGADLGMDRLPGHRFFFRAAEVRPIPRVLVAGVGNLFLGDDGFGCEVVRRLSPSDLPAGTTLRDFGTRGLDLAYALGECDAAILVDCAPRGREPGTLHLIEVPLPPGGPVRLGTHGMDPVKVLGLARELGPLPGRVYILGCEPVRVPDPESEEIVGELSSPVRAAVPVAAARIVELVERLAEPTFEPGRKE